MTLPTDNDARDTLLNPYYAVILSDHLFGNEPTGIKEDWVAANAGLIKDLGAQTWLVNLLAALAFKPERELTEKIDPSKIVVVSEKLRGKHEPITKPEDWVAANVKLIAELGAENWLWGFLEVLETGGLRAA